MRKHFLLFYDVCDDYATKRTAFRELHLKFASGALERRELVLGGALANPIDGAVLLFQGESAAVAEEFAQNDPYVRNGLVTRWHVREWTTVIGREASAQAGPAATPASTSQS